MKFKLENKAEGVIVCHLFSVLDKKGVAALSKGIETVLSNGKARLILNFDPKTIDLKGLNELEKNLRHYQVLARKMGGDLVYVVAKQLADEMRGAYSNLEIAINRILGKEDYSSLDQEKMIIELRAKNEKIRALEAENLIASEKLKELLARVSEPLNQPELLQSLKFYQALAFKAEEQPPDSPDSKERKS